jgi:TPR repeat protein
MSLFRKIVDRANSDKIENARVESKKNVKKSIKILETLANKKNVESANILAGAFAYGILFDNTDAVAIDNKLAEYWYKKAMDFGDIKAEEALWQFYIGIGEMEKVKTHLISSADNGIVNSMRVLGLAYLRGLFMLPQNFEKGISWLRKGAKCYDDATQIELANAYYEGKVIQKDLFKAYVWYSLAAYQMQKEDYVRYKRAMERWIEPSNKHIADALRPKMTTENAAQKKRNEISSLLTREEIVKAQNIVEKCLNQGFDGINNI